MSENYYKEETMDENNWRSTVEAAGRGDNKAFEVLYRETERSVYFTCLKLLKNEDNAKDVMQDTYMTAIRKLAQLDDGARFPEWINRIAINKCMDQFRKKSEDSLDEMTDMGFDPKDDENLIPDNYVTDDVKRQVVMDIINNSLSEVQRQTVIIYYYDGLSLEETAGVMDCPVKTVSSRLVTAREKIKEAVLIYEKKNKDRLHVLAPVPILTLLLRMEAQKVSVPDIPLSAFSELLTDVSAAASANTVSTGIAGGSMKTNFLTGKVIAGVTAGIIAAGGITAAVLNGRNGKENPAPVSVSTADEGDSILDNITEADNTVTNVSDRKRKPFEVTYAEVPKDEYKYLNGLWFKLPEGFSLSGFDTLSDNYVNYDNCGPEYGVINVTMYTISDDEHKTKEEVREMYFEDFDDNDVITDMDTYPSLKDVKADTSETVNIIGHEFLRETGTITVSDFVKEYPLNYTAYFGNLAFPTSYEKKNPDEPAELGTEKPVAFLVYSSDNSSAKKAQVSEWADFIAENFEDPDCRYNDLIPDDGYTAETDGSEVKGKITKAGNFEVLLPDGWSITGPGGSENTAGDITLHEDSDPHTKIRINYYSHEYACDSFYMAVVSALDKHSMNISGTQAVDEFTCGNYSLHGVKYTKILEDNAVYPASEYFQERVTDNTGLHISCVKYDEDTPEFQAIISSLKIYN